MYQKIIAGVVLTSIFSYQAAFAYDAQALHYLARVQAMTAQVDQALEQTLTTYSQKKLSRVYRASAKLFQQAEQRLVQMSDAELNQLAQAQSTTRNVQINRAQILDQLHVAQENLNAEQLPPEDKYNTLAPKKKGKGWLVFLTVLIVLGVVVVGTWYLMPVVAMLWGYAGFYGMCIAALGGLLGGIIVGEICGAIFGLNKDK